MPFVSTNRPLCRTKRRPEIRPKLRPKLRPDAAWRTLLFLSLIAALQGARAEINVRFEGGDFPDLRANVEALVVDDEERDERSMARYSSFAKDQAAQAVKALGYYDPQITAEVVGQGEDVDLNLVIVPGQPVLIRNRTIRIEGPASEDSEFLLPDIKPLEPGEVLDHGAYSRVKGSIENRALELGYFASGFSEHQIQVNPQEHWADIVLVFKSGPRYLLGEVSFVGDHELSPDFLREYVPFEPGDQYRAGEIAGLNTSLANSGYFSQVYVDASPDKAKDLLIPITVNLEKRPRRSVAAGVGFSTDVGPRFSGKWEEHWINPQGHSRGLETEISAPRQNLSAWYEIPLTPPMTDTLRYSAGYQKEDIEDTESELLTVGGQWKHLQDNDWLRVISLRWHGERYTIGDSDEESTALLLPGIGYSKLHSDSAIDPSRGYRLRADLTGASDALLSQTNLLRLDTTAKGLITLFGKHRFLSRINFGWMATDNFRKIPPSLRFYAGGDQSVRGYAYKSLGPENADGDVIGGRYLVVGSMEYQYSLFKSWRLATFIDHGNALDSFSDPLATGVGAGVRWISPVGPLRLDVAKGLDDDLGGGWRLHFTIGPEL